MHKASDLKAVLRGNSSGGGDAKPSKSDSKWQFWVAVVGAIAAIAVAYFGYHRSGVRLVGRNVGGLGRSCSLTSDLNAN
jgi:hypothetical protein